MTGNEYQKLAARTIRKDMTVIEMEKHALFEMASEVGEIHGLYQKELQGHPISIEHLEKEIGDLLWGIAEPSGRLQDGGGKEETMHEGLQECHVESNGARCPVQFPVFTAIRLGRKKCTD